MTANKIPAYYSALELKNLLRLKAVGPQSGELTVYRKRFDSVHDRIPILSSPQLFDNFVVRYGERTDHPESCAHPRVQALAERIQKGRSDFVEEARRLTGDTGLSLIACAEDHAGASAADHSNFLVVCRRMIVQAQPADLDHIYVIEAGLWPFPVFGIFANVEKLSPDMQDVFLARVKWIQSSWPMRTTEFQSTLADRFSTLRQNFVQSLLKDCGRIARMSEGQNTAMLEKWAEAPHEAKFQFSLYIIETLHDGLVFVKNTAETFDRTVMERHGATVAKEHRRYLDLS